MVDNTSSLTVCSSASLALNIRVFAETSNSSWPVQQQWNICLLLFYIRANQQKSTRILLILLILAASISARMQLLSAISNFILSASEAACHVSFSFSCSIIQLWFYDYKREIWTQTEPKKNSNTISRKKEKKVGDEKACIVRSTCIL